MLKQLPNLLSGLRLVAAPVAAWAMLNGHYAVSLAVFVVAGFSDLLDGYVARRFHAASRLGAWLDPAADKLLMLLCFVALMQLGHAPMWLVLLVVVRDLAVTAGAMIAWALAWALPVAPLMIGKAAAAVQVLYIGGWLSLLSFGQQAPQVMLAAAWTVAIFALLSFLAYGRIFLQALSAGRRVA